MKNIILKSEANWFDLGDNAVKLDTGNNKVSDETFDALSKNSWFKFLKEKGLVEINAETEIEKRVGPGGMDQDKKKAKKS